MTMTKRGRKPKSYITTWGETIPGLVKDYDGRWRIIKTRDRYAEADERTAVARFRDWESKQRDDKVILNGQDVYGQGQLFKIDSTEFWSYVRHRLLNDAVDVARKVGIPQLANLTSFDFPGDSIRLADLLNLYREKSEGERQGTSEAIKSFQKMMTETRATTLDELTTARLTEFRAKVVSGNLAPSTVAAYFGRCKSIIRFGLKFGMDARQISPALARMTVLHAPKNDRKHNPNPIGPEEFSKLYGAADERWRAMMLLGLNLCCYMSEVLSLRWDELNLTSKTFISDRNKTKVVRVGVLWDETVLALEGIKRTGSPFVFVSRQGTKFSPKGQWKVWNALRESVGSDATFDQIRDAAYTSAMEGAADERQARVLAGHSTPGLTDNYVKRNPHFVASAVEAIRVKYPIEGMQKQKSK